MSRNTNPTAALGELFVDATREVLEKGRIKAQIVRLEKVMNADRIRLKNVYAEIGRMYVENTLKKNSAKLEYLYKSIDHLNLRLERAQARLDMLNEAHSVDECTQAFRAELSSKIKQAQDSAAIAALNVKKKAQDAASSLGDAAGSVKKKAAETVQNISQRAATVVKADKKSDDFFEDEDKDFSALLAELDADETEADEEAQEINSILSNLDSMLKEVEESTPETEADTPHEDGESAESFDF